MKNIITTFSNKADRETFQTAALEAIAKVAKEYGLQSVHGAGYVYDVLDCTFKFKVVCDSNTRVAQSKNLADSKMVGFSENVIGKKFTEKGKCFTITGININSKHAVDCTRADGRAFGFNASYIKSLTADGTLLR